MDPTARPSAVAGCECGDGFLGVDCLVCAPGGGCSQCIAYNAGPYDANGCMCNAGFRNETLLNSTDACIACTAEDLDCGCDPLCVSCYGAGAGQCFSCKFYSILGVCIAKCPVGYSVVGQECTLEVYALPAVRFLFLSMGSTYFDSIANLTASSTSKNGLRRLETTGPITSPERGIYFPGSSALEVNLNEQVYIFGITFSVSLWVNPDIPDGVLVYKTNATGLLLQISIKSLTTQVQIVIESATYNITALNTLQLNQWNHILFSLEYTNYSSSRLTVNGVYADSAVLSPSPFLDSLNSSFCFAANCQLSNFYTGFIYVIEIYPYTPDVTDLLSTNCSGCTVCPMTQICIPNCNVTSFYSYPAGLCSGCSAQCNTGCVSDEDCSLCADQYCIACYSANLYSCTQCSSGYELHNSTCVACSQGYFFDNTTLQCTVCGRLCLACVSLGACTSCQALSTLGANNQCICNLGYSGSTACIRNTFNATASVNQENLVTLRFSEAIQGTLTISNVQVYLNQSNLSFVITSVDSSTFTLNISYSAEITNNTKVIIEFLGEIVSQDNSLLETTEITANLFANNAYTSAKVMQSKIKSAAALGKTGAAVGTSAALGLSLMSMSPGGIFNFLNTAETIYTVYLFNIEFYPPLGSFLVNLIPSSLIPNPFSYLISSDKGVTMLPKYQTYGSNTNLILLNAGENIAAFVLFILAFFLFLIIDRIKLFKGKFTKILYYYKFGFFLRYWIQSFLGNSISCIIGIVYSRLENTIQIVDFSLCLLILVHNI